MIGRRLADAAVAVLLLAALLAPQGRLARALRPPSPALEPPVTVPHYFDRLEPAAAPQPPARLGAGVAVAGAGARPWTLRPSARGRFWGAPFEVNADGLWDVPRTRRRTAAALRVTLLGDSLVMGLGLPRASGPAAALERALSVETGGGPVEVLNFAVMGYTAAMMLDQWRGLASSYETDVVAVCLSYWSVTKDLHALHEGRDDAYGAAVRALAARAALSSDHGCSLCPRAGTRRERRAYAAALLAGLSEEARKRGVKVVAVYVPTMHAWEARAGGAEDVRAAAAAAGVAFADLSPLSDALLARAPQDGHMNAAGFLRLAGALAPLLAGRDGP